MKGHFHITCTRKANGSSYLRRQSFAAPLHLSKPHEDAGALVVNMVSPTAGVFDDDEIDIRARVEAGARLVLTTPSSSRIYRSRNGGYGAVRQAFTVEAGGFLEFYPEPFIPHAGARYRQTNTIAVASDATLLYFEWLTPGRTASGEVFEYAELQWDTDIAVGEKLLLRERHKLTPHDTSLASLRLAWPQAHYLSCCVVCPQISGATMPFPLAEIEALGEGGESGGQGVPDGARPGSRVYIGCGPLALPGSWSIKALCADSLAARATMGSLRGILYAAMGGAPPFLGRF
ncbi:hypothetical protein DB346_12720 [Verrucomicrobia bacterium LW23]|nr:hypothetical protein DB346_12720 [Verrucomicrobia bacterium LW23]